MNQRLGNITIREIARAAMISEYVLRSRIKELVTMIPELKEIATREKRYKWI